MGGAAVLVARERFAFDRDLCPTTGHDVDRFFGRGWRQATTIPELARLLPEAAAWPLTDIESPTELWRGEVAVVRRAAAEATRVTAARRFTRDTVAAAMTLLLIDLWHVNVAIELAGRGPSPTEVFDAVA
jgi:hypothetical protein